MVCRCLQRMILQCSSLMDVLTSQIEQVTSCIAAQRTTPTLRCLLVYISSQQNFRLFPINTEISTKLFVGTAVYDILQYELYSATLVQSSTYTRETMWQVLPFKCKNFVIKHTSCQSCAATNQIRYTCRFQALSSGVYLK